MGERENALHAKRGIELRRLDLTRSRHQNLTFPAYDRKRSSVVETGRVRADRADMFLAAIADVCWNPTVLLNAIVSRPLALADWVAPEYVALGAPRHIGKPRILHGAHRLVLAHFAPDPYDPRDVLRTCSP